MKKIYSFIALMLMCFAGTANAQKAWEVVDEESVEAIEAGEDHYYVIKEGDNTSADGPGPHSQGEYLSSLGNTQAEPVHEAIYNFIEYGTKEVDGETFTVYVLKNVANGKYLSTTDARYVATKAEAWKFTARKGVDHAENLDDTTPWIEYSNAVSETRSMNAVSMGAWVFCAENARQYMCFYGNPAFADYIDTNNWLILRAQERQAPAEEQFSTIYNKYFESYGSEDDIAAAFPVGDNPGYINQEMQNKLKETYTQAYNMSSEGATDEDYLAMCNTIVTLFEEELPKAIVPVTANYYVFKNVDGRGFLTVTADNKKGRGNSTIVSKNVAEGTDYNNWTPEMTTSWDIDNAKYIWKLEPAKEEGKFLFKNFGTGTYLHSKDGFVMVEKDGEQFEVSSFQGQKFVITYNGGMLHQSNHEDRKLLNYNVAADPGSQYNIYTINTEIVDSLTAKVAQDALNAELKGLVSQANEDLNTLKYANFVEGDMYMAGDSGLVTSVLKANSWATQEGALENLFDGKLNTYFHTAWNAGDVEAQATEGSHWIKVDLGKAVTNLKVKFSKRQSAANGHISKYALYALSDGDAESEDMGELVATSADSIEFQFNNDTHIADYKFEKPVQYLRFEVLSTRGRDASTWDGMTAETGPFWHMSELRMYDPADIVANPYFEAIPENVKADLQASIDKANAELKEKKATKETIAELEANLEKYWDAYPDPNELKNDVEAAAQMAEKAVEYDGQENGPMGYFKAGAKAALQAVVDEIDGKIKAVEEAGKALSIEEIQTLSAQLEKAVADFNAMLNVPEAGKVYVMVCKSLSTGETEKVQTDACIASVDADVKNGTPVFRYKYYDGVDTKFNVLWLVEKTEKGFAFKNLANGLYMNNVYEGLTKEEIKDLELPNNQIGYSKTPKTFTLESFTGEGLEDQGLFVISLMKGQYMNFQGDGMVMVHYGDRNDAHAPMTFVSADEVAFEGTYELDVEGGKTQIKSLPFAINEVVTQEGGAYEVLGINGDKIILQSIDGAIEAGTPFIIKTQAENAEEGTEAETAIELSLPNMSVEESLDLTYNYEPVVKNGLVSTPNSMVIGAGYGVLVNGTVIPSEEGRRVAAASGLFNKDIPATEEEGDAFIAIEGELTGEGDATAVENVVIVKNVASDVYTISGVKVRHNVKAANATQGLPKGVYIVGGKKVIVK